MNRKKNFIITFIFIVVFTFSCSFISKNISFTKKFELNCKEDNSFQTSNNEISIITPENKTYIEPMRGYYLASYGFESDPLGLWHPNPPFDETILNPINMTVVKDQFGHKNVLKLIDCSAIDRVDLAYTVSPSDLDDGTIEFWWATNDTSKYGWHIFDLYRHVYPYSIGYMELNGGRFHMRTNTEFLDHSVIPQNNTWYHIRVDWSRYAGYQGLSARRYKVTIDGTEGPELVFNQNNNVGMRYIRFSTDNVEKDYEWYIDAIAVSIDINYNAGDNLNEGLLLCFENTTNFDWIGYSLDGLANKTILGNSTIPMPTAGSHNIQVFGNDSLGTMYASNLRYFTLDLPPSISIITPSIDEFYSNNAPPFSISITSFYQTTTWYTLDGGGTNITFTGSSGIINQTEWDKQGEGPITIRFYVNDSLGRLNYAEITIKKDITDPVITINSPLFGAQFTTMPPSFNISVDELNIDVMWYTIDDGLTNYDISEYSGYIDSIAWNIAPNGAITIRFYVRDKAGNIDYEDVTVVKNAQPYIPPDNNFIVIISVAIGALSIFIGFSLILYIILSRNRKYEPHKFKEPKKPEIRVKSKYGYLMCPYCHNENHITNNYCIFCGASLADFKPDNM